MENIVMYGHIEPNVLVEDCLFPYEIWFPVI